uniref:Uncharacterized protein n=1 Tax=Lepeophtheirus salmonis TaxID=72036 RepID=A0A0K2VBJ1_LEPSM
MLFQIVSELIGSTCSNGIIDVFHLNPG